MEKTDNLQKNGATWTGNSLWCIQHPIGGRGLVGGQQGRWVWCGGRGSREGGCGVVGGAVGKVGVVWWEGQ